MSDEELQIEGIRLTNPDKVLYPEQGITKRALADYYLEVADVMCPLIKDRPITLVRCPTGREKKCFFQRHPGSGVPSAFGQVEVPGFEEPYLYIANRAGLVAAVQMGVLEMHPWGSRREHPLLADRVVFDFDPGEGTPFTAVVEAALELRQRLEAMSLAAFVKTTGGKGLHVVVPITPGPDWPTVKRFAKDTAGQMAADSPDRYLTRISKAERQNRILIDYLRNDLTSTAVAPYSTRSRPGAPVSTPLVWEEVTPALDPSAFSLATVPARVKDRGDPWARIDEVRQDLPS